MTEPVCFTCGLHVGEPYRLNRMDNGQICPTCRERVLESLPSILPALPRLRVETPELPFEAYDEADGPPFAS